MICRRCGFRLIAGKFIHDALDGQFYAATEDGSQLMSTGTFCAPEHHIVYYDPDEVAASAREIVRRL